MVKVLIIDDVPVENDESGYIEQLAEEDAAEALRYSLGLGDRYAEEEREWMYGDDD